MELLVGWVILAVLIGWWASQWGRGAGRWFLLAVIFSPLVAGIALLVVGVSNPKRPCPVCGTAVPIGVTVCASCGYDYVVAAKGGEQTLRT